MADSTPSSIGQKIWHRQNFAKHPGCNDLVADLVRLGILDLAARPRAGPYAETFSKPPEREEQCVPPLSGAIGFHYMTPRIPSNYVALLAIKHNV
jgi:hypothetical protein